MDDTRIRWLQQTPIFGAIDDRAIEWLLQESRVVEVATGGVFFREGDAADAMYVLEQGDVQVVKRWREHELLLRRLASGDCFGEMALLDLYPRSATVRALSSCRALTLGSAQLYQLFERAPEQFALIQMNLAREMSRRLRATDDLLFRARMGETIERPPLAEAPAA